MVKHSMTIAFRCCYWQKIFSGILFEYKTPARYDEIFLNKCALNQIELLILPRAIFQSFNQKKILGNNQGLNRISGKESCHLFIIQSSSVLGKVSWEPEQ